MEVNFNADLVVINRGSFEGKIALEVFNFPPRPKKQKLWMNELTGLAILLVTISNTPLIMSFTLGNNF